MFILNARQKPTRILYPIEYWPTDDIHHQVVLENSIQKLESFLSVKRTPISLEEIWKPSNRLKKTYP